MQILVCPDCRTRLASNARFCLYCGTRLEARARQPTSLVERLAMALGPDYTVLGELGRGGFAVVYAVRDTRLGRYLAVKVMRPEFVAAPTVRERFLREARFVAQLDHPNILRVVFAGEGAGLSYFAMHRVRGESLRERLDRERPLPVAEAVRIFVGVARGLAYAHAHGVVHRDVKPGNVMLTADGRVLLLDFGIAKGLAADSASLSLTGAVIGTPEYMSPEQASGNRGVDHRSDLYSLGVVTFEALTGTLPFEGDTFGAVLARQISEPAPDLRTRRPDIPDQVALAIARCLVKDPSGRWQSAAEAADALQAPV